MKQKKSILAVIFSLIFSIFFLSGQLFAYKESDLKKLLDTKECPECDLSKAGYQSIHKLSTADLSGANLYDANLYDANLGSAKLSGANLSGANLTGANLRGADLSGANLSEANLTGANLTGADLSKANLSDILIDKKARSTNKKYLLAKLEEKERKRKAKQMLALQKKKEKETAELPKNELGQFYRSYAGLKKCHEVRKGYMAVHVNSVEMTNIKSKAKSIEEGIFNKYPDIKPMKDEIWKKFTRSITTDEIIKALEKGEILEEGVVEMTTKLSRWQGVCNGYKTIYNNALKMYGGGGTAEKDF